MATEEVKEYQSVESVAMLILALGPELGAKIMRGFEHSEVVKVTKAMSSLRDNKVIDVQAALAGFFQDIRQNAGIGGGTRGYVEEVLRQALDGDLAKNLISEVYGDDLKRLAKDLEWIPDEVLVPRLNEEHIEIQALLISCLEPSHAGRILNMYDEEAANRIMLKISTTDIITSSQAQTLKDLVERCKEAYKAASAQPVDGVKVTASIINHMERSHTAFLDFIGETNEDLKQLIEESIIDFALVLKQESDVFDVLNAHVSVDTWAYALKGTADVDREKIIGTFPSRIANELKSTISRLGQTPKGQVERARKEIIDAVRKLQQDDEIVLTFGNEERMD
ncbi:FliG C-terminal domain-containing protein [Vibrio breoganii]|uniref:FliG C-terminal domain-containing protein n=1 Tax=Vibrio breoganii TaxID=553239 RepID=UPI000C833FE8|nr:FliG C-terminal domain-containing protein [Vibrio breoganii]PML12778.1 hypothetical protein BCT84_02515 [Vibrio breoganii]